MPHLHAVHGFQFTSMALNICSLGTTTTILLSVLELLNSLLITTLAEEVMCLCVLLITVKLLIK